jgi:orotate phosphoribosyltransferase
MAHDIRVAEPRHEALFRRLYEAASIKIEPAGLRYVTHSGRNVSWAMDLRRPLLRSELLRPVAAALAERLAALEVTQVTGKGMGAAPLVCGVVAQGSGIDGSLVRDQPKGRGFVRPFEGELDAGWPVWVLEDIVNSGRSALAAATALRGHGLEVQGVLCLFFYTWGPGRSRLNRHGLRLEPMAELSRRGSFSRDLRSRLQNLVP